MDGYQFEYQCAEILKRNGFSRVQVTQSSGDQGVDIIAHKHRKNTVSNANTIPIRSEIKRFRKPTQVTTFMTVTKLW